MSDHDVIVVGGGISGAVFAYHAARAGRRVLVLEREACAGGCLASQRTDSGFWYELGAHTCYNSYGALLEVLDGCGLLGRLQRRGKAVLRFHDGTDILPGKNLLLLLRLFRKGELLRASLGWWGARQEGQSVRSYYSRLVGPTNYERVLGPMLAAVVSQPAHAFPAGMLFKKRPRRKDVGRSFTLPGGLRTAVEEILRQPGIEVRCGVTVTAFERAGGEFVAVLDDGSRLGAGAAALAVPPGAAAKLLARILPGVAREVAKLQQVEVDSLGFAVRADRVRVPYATFLIPLGDVFHSVVTRDVVPDPERRGFTFHFLPGRTRAQRLERAAEVLGIRPEEMENPAERRAVLPAPVLGHEQVVEAIDRGLAGEGLALTGNWFGGLSIEDCALRSRAEWRRLSSTPAAAS